MLSPLLPPWLFIQSTIFMCSFLSPSFGIVFLPPVSLEQITTFLYKKPNCHNFNCIEYDLTISHAIQHFQCQISLVSVHSSQSLQDYCTIKIAEFLFYLVRSDFLYIIEQVYYNSRKTSIHLDEELLAMFPTMNHLQHFYLIFPLLSRDAKFSQEKKDGRC